MSRVTAKYQITIPLKVRNELGIIPGAEVDISKEGNKYILVLNPVEEIKSKWRGRFKSSSSSDQYLDDIRGPIE
ncbi:MAG: AbrB family transcriptional regulator [Thermodesulfovibrio sp.]|nr:AbrB family transcriptional regulator [Thermodesulfovibrio sp.]